MLLYVISVFQELGITLQSRQPLGVEHAACSAHKALHVFRPGLVLWHTGNLALKFYRVGQAPTASTLAYLSMSTKAYPQR